MALRPGEPGLYGCSSSPGFQAPYGDSPLRPPHCRRSSRWARRSRRRRSTRRLLSREGSVVISGLGLLSTSKRRSPCSGHTSLAGGTSTIQSAIRLDCPEPIRLGLPAARRRPGKSDLHQLHANITLFNNTGDETLSFGNTAIDLFNGISKSSRHDTGRLVRPKCLPRCWQCSSPPSRLSCAGSRLR